ncbi:MAG: amino acid ABC transporter substrate-binding protein [Acetobacteraceae bacterium]
MRRVVAAVAVAAALAGPARAEGVLERVRAEGVLRCGGMERPGVLEQRGEGLRGLAVDLCRAVAVAVLGPPARVEVQVFGAGPLLDPVRGGAVDLAVLSGDVVAAEGLAGRVVRGPTIFIEQLALLVKAAATARVPADLAGAGICFMIASPAPAALEAALAGSGFVRLGFEEEVEMLDAFNAGRCEAIASAATSLARLRRTRGALRGPVRMLDEALDVYPVFAATPVRDGAWAALVGWVLDGLIAGSRPASQWRGGGEPVVPGLQPDWLQRVTATVGSYAAMRERAFGAASGLDLPAGPNQPWPAGLLLPAGP